MALKELLIFRRHGRQYIPDLEKPVLPDVFGGRPVIRPGWTGEEGETAVALCPTGAIGYRASTLSLDLGKCLFCRACAIAFPDKITFTNDYRTAVNRRENLVITSGTDRTLTIDPAMIRKEIRTLFRGALKLRQVSAGGDNSAEMELNAAGNVNFDMGRFGIEFVASPRHADGIVITGPVTRNMSEALYQTYEAVPSPKLIILAGTDAISGGIYATGRELDRSFLSEFPADLFIPGHPPHPLTFIFGVVHLVRGRSNPG